MAKKTKTEKKADKVMVQTRKVVSIAVNTTDEVVIEATSNGKFGIDVPYAPISLDDLLAVAQAILDNFGTEQ